MPACLLHLIALGVPPASFISKLRNSSLDVVLVSKVIRWVIRPEKLSVEPLLRPKSPWDLLVITAGNSPLPDELKHDLTGCWSINAGVPSRLVNGFGSRNKDILHPNPSDVPALTGALEKPRIANSSQGLELSDELREWIKSFSKAEGSGAVSMLNLLAFKPGMKEEYLKYGKAFADSIGSKRGGNAKIVGNVIDKEQGWDEIAVAHYPSIEHFADMLASEDYQEVNHRHRIPSLEDTCILCTSELAVEEFMNKGSSNKGASKL